MEQTTEQRMKMLVQVSDDTNTSTINLVQYYDVADVVAADRNAVTKQVRAMIGYAGVTVTYKYWPATGMPQVIVLKSKARRETVRITLFPVLDTWALPPPPAQA